jgi:PKD repeat protein
VIEIVDSTYREGHFGAWAYQNGTEMILDNVVLDFTPVLVNACFTAEPLTGGAPLDVKFDASCSSAKGEIASYDWDFGDGTTGEDVTVSHQFEPADTYTVTLTVTDVAGNSATAETAVRVFESAEDFLDDFSRPDGPIDGWTVWRGDWSISAETLVTTTGGQEHWI